MCAMAMAMAVDARRYAKQPHQYLTTREFLKMRGAFLQWKINDMKNSDNLVKLNAADLEMELTTSNPLVPSLRSWTPFTDDDKHLILVYFQHKRYQRVFRVGRHEQPKNKKSRTPTFWIDSPSSVVNSSELYNTLVGVAKTSVGVASEEEVIDGLFMYRTLISKPTGGDLYNTLTAKTLLDHIAHTIRGNIGASGVTFKRMGETGCVELVVANDKDEIAVIATIAVRTNVTIEAYITIHGEIFNKNEFVINDDDAQGLKELRTIAFSHVTNYLCKNPGIKMLSKDVQPSTFKSTLDGLKVDWSLYSARNMTRLLTPTVQPRIGTLFKADNLEQIDRILNVIAATALQYWNMNSAFTLRTIEASTPQSIPDKNNQFAIAATQEKRLELIDLYESIRNSRQ